MLLLVYIHTYMYYILAHIVKYLFIEIERVPPRVTHALGQKQNRINALKLTVYGATISALGNIQLKVILSLALFNLKQALSGS